MEIPSDQIIAMMIQFCQENNLIHSCAALEKETGVKAHSVQDLEGIKQFILNGDWDMVLQALDKLKLPIKKSCQLYEQVDKKGINNDLFDDYLNANLNIDLFIICNFLDCH